jgi:D-alanine-D-alanine ligase
MHGIKYTGSNQFAAAFDLDKSLAKSQVQTTNLSTSDYFVANPGSHSSERALPLPFPLFLKPTKMGGGQGVDEFSVVRNFSQFEAKVEAIFSRYKVDVLVEKYLPGREFSVAILLNEQTDKLIAMPIELTSEPNKYGDSMLSQDVKNANCEVVVEVADPVLRRKVCDLALDVFSCLGARDYGRIDIRLDELGNPQFLEANLVPSLISGYGSFPKACLMNQNLDYEPMILGITNLGFNHPTIPENDDLIFNPVDTDTEFTDLLLAVKSP